MNTAPISADVYTDFQGLQGLKRAARDDSDAALKEVARQFEAMFLQMMLKSARDANFGDDFFGSEQMKTYQGMFDSQIAMHLTKGKGIGLSEVLAAQLSNSVKPSSTQNDVQGQNQLDSQSNNYNQQNNEVRTTVREYMRRSQLQTDATQTTVVKNDAINNISNNDHNKIQQNRFESPKDFIDTLLPMAQRVSERTGISADILIAQAALETGWGKSVISHADGRSSFNLFNIKADQRWDGDRAVKRTIEYSDGIASRQSASFRSYESYEESFADYVEFVGNQPRYNKAMNVVDNSKEYITELQQAGYATDPLYAEKVLRVLNGVEINSALSSIKL